MARRSKTGRKGSKQPAEIPHRHYLYTASVQSVEADLGFFRRVYQKRHGRPFHRLREDFCGTAAQVCAWVRRGPANEAWGVDLDRATLAWGLEHYVPVLGRGISRLHLLCRDVRSVTAPKVDIVNALNFSYSVFKTRETLGGYFRQVRRSLARGGAFILDAWGGMEIMQEDQEVRKVESERAFDGTRIPAFTYIWEQARFNPVDHHIVCHIHFRLRGGKKLRRAFTYDWRLWTLPELTELLAEAGFRETQVYVDGWDEKAGEGDGIFRRRTYFENQDAWIAYVVAWA